ncbi:nitroreductase family protein [Absiella sp. AM29-15]|uniref:nitroreductase family protein n=1 Tax=Absiella sp. AM29-15 TaxID=2292278 RepID=UPI000E429E4B|nr:nitroreductase family protein [Absiella sp. AM29-15]RGC53928.1 nitroreductase [Absiella sp. AM29-15]
MKTSLYEMIYKRKSFHLFRNTGNETLTAKELTQIQKIFETCIPLEKDIKVDMQILPADQTTCKRGQEYCILLYSEKKPNYLQNIGYIGEQLDLYLASMNIGALWFGIGKVEETTYHGLDFVIMLAIKKVKEEKFRKDMFKSKRKPEEEIWSGTTLLGISDIVRFAPSACNTQPWIVENHQDYLSVYRYKKPGKRGIMPAVKVSYYNQIDIGIFLLFLELCLEHKEIGYERELFHDDGTNEKALNAVYKLKKVMKKKCFSSYKTDII